ncbi:hypothetical protein [Azohydromonas lata]|uniref:hypothetical protein n=1 Tax=Azohydromonas lata TaxID=45677 RepID=UPI000832BB9A|nr:hypothetical protein [Azohydromonas lata]
MRRRLVIMLLMLLPLQFVWGAAAAYCGHETAPTAQHFGHHVHVHKSARADDGAKAPADLGLADNDCPVCHLGGPPLPPGVAVFVCTQAAPPQHPAVGVPDSSAPPGTPERPNWLLAA